MEPAFAVLVRALRQEGLTEQASRLEVLSVWARAVGPKIASRTTPHAFRRGCLWVQAATPTWQNELTFLREAIVAKVNAQLSQPRVTSLKVTSGTLPAEAPGEVARRLRQAQLSPTPREVERASRCATPIADAATRAAFTRLMATDLRHRLVGPETPRDRR